jgi:hypothetical protein
MSTYLKSHSNKFKFYLNIYSVFFLFLLLQRPEKIAVFLNEMNLYMAKEKKKCIKIHKNVKNH